MQSKITCGIWARERTDATSLLAADIFSVHHGADRIAGLQYFGNDDAARPPGRAGHDDPWLDHNRLLLTRNGRQRGAHPQILDRDWLPGSPSCAAKPGFLRRGGIADESLEASLA